MKTVKITSIFLVLTVLFFCCNKDINEHKLPTATGTLGENGGNCTPFTLSGTYKQGVALNSSNAVTIEVNVTAPGVYTISTDTVNGVRFSKTDTFTKTGADTIILNGTGTPVNFGSQNFEVIFGASTCSFSIDFISFEPAVGKFSGTWTCEPIIRSGTYFRGVELTTANTVTVEVNVTTPGSYHIYTDTVNGISFSKIGTFHSTGLHTVILNGKGIPVSRSPGATYTLKFGESVCYFYLEVHVLPGAGTYVGAPGKCAFVSLSGYHNSVLILEVNVTKTGWYRMTTNYINGVSWVGEGEFTTTGVQKVELYVQGLPNKTSTETFTATYGNSTCTFTADLVKHR